MIVVVVETDLAPGEHARLRHPLRKRVEIGVAEILGVVGMNARRRVNPVVLLAQSQGAANFLQSVARADGQQGAYAGLLRMRQHFGAIGVEIGGIKMCV